MRRNPNFAPEKFKEKSNGVETSFRFGDFELNAQDRTLTRAGVPVALAPKTFDAMIYFVANAERLVTKAALMEMLWPSTFVTETNLTNTVVSLRKALGQDAIRTVRRCPEG